MLTREIQRQNAILMLCRVVLLTALLACGLVIGRLLGQPLLGSQPFYLLTGAGYALTVLYALLHPFWSRHAAAAWSQIAGDVLLITGFVYVTGGAESPFSLLYFLPIIAASMMLGRAGAMSCASGAWVMYALLSVLIMHGWIPDVAAALQHAAGAATAAQSAVDSAAASKRVAYGLFSHFVGFFTVAHLSSYLTLKLKAAGDELAEKSEVLAQVQALNKSIIDSITSGIVTTDLSGAVTFLNHGAEEITGRRLSRVAGASMDAFLGCEDGYLGKVKANLERERRFRFETSLLRPDGTRIFLGFSSAVLKDQRGEPMGFIFSFQDLTDIKALEEEIRLKDRMAALGQMAAGMAHEIRNPLASMSGSVQILRKSLHPSEEEGELLDIVLRESRRLDGIIRDFLLFARPGRFHPRPSDLVPILRDTLTLLRNAEGFEGKYRLEADMGEREVGAMVDPDMIRQVFWNLAKNALKAMPDGGVLRVSARREGDREAVVSFSDGGIGMSDAEVHRAFEPFHTGFREGTGLGLAVVFRIVEEHHGRIRVRSAVGAGTEVTVTLPACEQDAIRRDGVQTAAGAAP